MDIKVIGGTVGPAFFCAKYAQSPILLAAKVETLTISVGLRPAAAPGLWSIGTL
jgi:hypothetical protein